MPINRRDLFRAAGASAGAMFLAGCAAKAPAAAAESEAFVVPPFVAPTADKPLHLSFNENLLGMSPKAKKAAMQALAEASYYPFVACEQMRKACAAFMGGKPENIMLSHGSAESIRASIESHITPDAVLFVPALTYSDGEDTAVKNGVKVVKVPMGPKWSIDVDAMRKAVAAHKGHSIVYFVNPNNPTSTIADCAKLVAWIRSRPRNTFFVIDEAYAEYVTDPSFISCKTLVDEGFDNVCVLKTFSKIFAMAGLRLGFAYAAPEVIKTIRKQVAYDVMINIVAIRAALAEIDDKVFIETSRNENTKARGILFATLDELGIEYLPSQTNFAFMNLKAPLKPFADRMLKERHILVGRPFPPAVEWCRISLGTADDMKFFCEALRDFRKNGWV